MKTLWTLLAVAMVTLAVGCGGDEDEGGGKGPGEACDKDADCANGSCIVDADGNKACAAGGGNDDGGW